VLARAEVIAETGLHQRQVLQYGDERGVAVAEGLLLGREHPAEQVQRPNPFPPGVAEHRQAVLQVRPLGVVGRGERQGFLQQVGGLGRLAAAGQHEGQPVQAGQGVRVALTQAGAADLQGAAEQRLGGGQVALPVQQRRQVVEGLGRVRVVLPQAVAAHLQRPAEPHAGRHGVAA